MLEEVAVDDARPGPLVLVRMGEVGLSPACRSRQGIYGHVSKQRRWVER